VTGLAVSPVDIDIERGSTDVQPGPRRGTVVNGKAVWQTPVPVAGSSAMQPVNHEQVFPNVAAVMSQPPPPPPPAAPKAPKPHSDLDGLSPICFRSSFIKKVYALLVCMIVVTVAVASLFRIISTSVIEQNRQVFGYSLLGLVAVRIGMLCFLGRFMEHFPGNYVFLFVFTVLHGLSAGIISVLYALPMVLLAAGLTAIIFLVLTIYAMCTKRDFTGCGPYLLAALTGLIIMGILSMCPAVVKLFPLWQFAFAGLGAVVLSLFIVFDTQMIIGGTHRYGEFSLDDYTFAALALHIDIVGLYNMLLALLTCSCRR
jgi:hypothetical protein